MDAITIDAAYTRRALLGRLMTGVAVLTCAATLGPSNAAAGRVWCQTDPVFLINDKRLHLYAFGSEPIHEVVTGPTSVELLVPAQGVTAELVWADAGFGELGYDVRITPVERLEVGPRGGIPFAVTTRVPASDDLAIRVEAVYEHRNGRKTRTDHRNGRTNRKIDLRGTL